MRTAAQRVVYSIMDWKSSVFRQTLRRIVHGKLPAAHASCVPMSGTLVLGGDKHGFHPNCDNLLGRRVVEKMSFSTLAISEPDSELRFDSRRGKYENMHLKA